MLHKLATLPADHRLRQQMDRAGRRCTRFYREATLAWAKVSDDETRRLANRESFAA